jgi:hypothetical protein
MDAVNPKERRTVIRKPGNTIGPVRLRLDEGGFEARVHNISITGIGILTHRRLEPGTWLVLEAAEPSQPSLPELRAEVRHLTKCDEEEYLLGCRFSNLLTADDIMALG